MKFQTASYDSLIVYFGDTISRQTSKRLTSAYYKLKNARLEGIKEIIPAFSSLFVRYDIFVYEQAQIIQILKKLFQSLDLDSDFEGRVMEIGVYYSLQTGLDLERISKQKNLSIDEIIHTHSQRQYFVYAVGFLPAFAYMGEVDEKIATTRLESPRSSIPKGSVGIADNQTAIYPKQSPGGWNIIGKTPQELFSTKYKGLSYLKMGDLVRFKPITKKEFLNLGGVL